MKEIKELKPYSFRRKLNLTEFLFNNEIVMTITNMDDDVSQGIVINLNKSFQFGVEMTINSFTKQS